MIENVLLALGVFLAGAVADLCWAQYTLAVSALRENKATLWSGGIFIVGAVGITAYVERPWLMIPLAVGGMLATKLSVRRERIRLDKDVAPARDLSPSSSCCVDHPHGPNCTMVV